MQEKKSEEYDTSQTKRKQTVCK